MTPDPFPSELVEAAAKAVHSQIDGEYLPYMARVRDFTREEVLAGKLREADEEAERQNLEWCGELARAALAAVLPLIEQRVKEQHATAMNSLAAEIHRERNRALTAAVDALRNHDDGIRHEPGYTTGWDEAADFIAAMRLREAHGVTVRRTK